MGLLRRIMRLLDRVDRGWITGRNSGLFYPRVVKPFGPSILKFTRWNKLQRGVFCAESSASMWITQWKSWRRNRSLTWLETNNRCGCLLIECDKYSATSYWHYIWEAKDISQEVLTQYLLSNSNSVVTVRWWKHLRTDAMDNRTSSDVRFLFDWA